MMPETRLTKLVVINLAIAALTAFSLCVPHTVLAAEDPVPSQIKDLAMGANMASVKEMLNGSGQVATGVSRDNRGSEVVWTPAANPYYETIDFNFTEKDRLYIIRYNMKQGSREEYQGVKKAFFNLYKFDPEDTGPSRIKIGGNDALLYDRPKDRNTYFFEITDKKTGNKSIELFERGISAQDRPQKNSAESSEAPADQPQAAPAKDNGNNSASDNGNDPAKK